MAEIKGSTEGLKGKDGLAYRSRINIKTVDLISEGPIEGLVYAYLNFANKGTKGNVGYDSAPDVKVFPPGGDYVSPNSITAPLRSIYWNEVPIINDQGQLNFQNVQLSQAYGLPAGTERPDTSELTIVRNIGERFRKETSPKIYRIYNRDCKGIFVNLRIVQLARTTTGEDNQKLEPHTIDYNIFYRPFFSNNEEHAFIGSVGSGYLTGYVTKGYMHQDRINFFAADKHQKNPHFLGWEIKIEKASDDKQFDHKSTYQEVVFIDSISEIYTDRFAYPNSAVIVSNFNSEFFAQVPQRAFDCWLKKVKIPSNYTPNQRKYDESSPWNGTFSAGLAYTNNPAWVYYDLITNKIYGLGNYLTSAQIDKWTLYEIAKYCDTLVDDGFGGLEPRFTCNLYLQSREEAYKVLNDLASVFNAITYYGGGLIYAVQDSEKDPIVTFTNANVGDGNFNYSSSGRKFRHTVAMIRWSDPANFYRPSIEFVEDLDNIRKFGIRQVDLTAFACSSRGQAIRLGRYVLLSENMETETINFISGLEAAYLRPGDIFKVFDRHKKATRFGGRISLYESDGSGQYISLDDNITSSILSGITYKLSLLTPSSVFDPAQWSSVMNQDDVDSIRKSFLQSASFTSSAVTTVNGKTKITFAVGTFNTTDYDLSVPCIWTIELVTNPTNYSDSSTFLDTNYDLYRVIKVDEKENNQYEVFGLQYNQNKFDQIENGLAFERPTNVFQTIPEPPTTTVVTDEPVVRDINDLDGGISGTSGSSGSSGRP